MKFARVFLVIALIIVAGIAAIYLLAPLGYGGTATEDTAKVATVFREWDTGASQYATFNLLSIEGANLGLFQDNTWWSFGVLAFTFLVLLGSLLTKSVWLYVAFGLLGIVVAGLASFLAGGVLILLACIGIINYSRLRQNELKAKDFSFLYREYI